MQGKYEFDLFGKEQLFVKIRTAGVFQKHTEVWRCKVQYVLITLEADRDGEDQITETPLQLPSILFPALVSLESSRPSDKFQELHGTRSAACGTSDRAGSFQDQEFAKADQNLFQSWGTLQRTLSGSRDVIQAGWCN